ncbi:MAG TPA: hypothetical protein DDW29_06035, partial [Gammaproteobacteria bacterium]|nr:hypothetical protein [Gammaproteobacteria bacterium]
YLPFNETSGSIAYDSSANSLNGTLYSGSSVNSSNANWFPGVSGNSLFFDGNNQFVKMADGFDNFSQGLSVSMWVKKSEHNSYPRLIDFGDGESNNNIVLTYKSDGDFKYHTFDGTTNNGQTDYVDIPQLNDWINIAVT